MVEGKKGKLFYSADNGDGTFTNPVLYADYPDPAVIRVGEDYYMVSSTFNKMPGIPVCHSRDLVSWELIGYAYDRLELSEDYDLKNGKNRYGGGTWAPAFAWHPKNGRFYIGACSNQEGEGYLSFVSEHPEGPYRMSVLKEWLYDPGLLIDDDGRIYVYYGRDEIKMVELNEEGDRIISEPVTVYRNQFRGVLEGTHAMKREDMYYICASLCGKDGKKLVARGKSPAGPFESRIVGDDGPNMRDAHTHQGGAVDTPEGDWYYFLFQDAGPIGRVPSIQPLTWIEGWPMMGDPLNGFRAVTTWKKPVSDKTPCGGGWGGSDDFDRERLSLFWQWNHNPDNALWSLGERPGYLRLKAGKAGSLPEARNMLTQRTVGPWCRGTVKLFPEGLAEGDIAGLAMSNQYMPYGFCGITLEDGKYRLMMVKDGYTVEIQDMPEGCGPVYLRTGLDEYGVAGFSYSLDGAVYRQIGGEMEAVFSGRTYVGYGFGLFCFNREQEGGHADFDWFELETRGLPGNYRSAFEKTHCYRYDSCQDVRTQRSGRHYYSYELCDIGRGSHICFERVDFGEGADWFEASIATGEYQGTVEIYLDEIYGEHLGTLQVENTGGFHLYRTMCCRVKRTGGIHRLYLRFDSTDFRHETFRMDWFRFHPADSRKGE